MRKTGTDFVPANIETRFTSSVNKYWSYRGGGGAWKKRI